MGIGYQAALLESRKVRGICKTRVITTTLFKTIDATPKPSIDLLRQIWYSRAPFNEGFLMKKSFASAVLLALVSSYSFGATEVKISPTDFVEMVLDHPKDFPILRSDEVRGEALLGAYCETGGNEKITCTYARREGTEDGLLEVSTHGWEATVLNAPIAGVLAMSGDLARTVIQNLVENEVDQWDAIIAKTVVENPVNFPGMIFTPLKNDKYDFSRTRCVSQPDPNNAKVSLLTCSYSDNRRRKLKLFLEVEKDSVASLIVGQTEPPASRLKGPFLKTLVDSMHTLDLILRLPPPPRPQDVPLAIN